MKKSCTEGKLALALHSVEGEGNSEGVREARGIVGYIFVFWLLECRWGRHDK